MQHIITFIVLATSHACAAITVAPTLQPDAKDDSAIYRVSIPKPKLSTNRVPAYLQDIQSTYLADDDDDVIHIIEPPQHFQELKQRQQQKAGLKTAPQALHQHSQQQFEQPASSERPHIEYAPPPRWQHGAIKHRRPDTPLRLRNVKMQAARPGHMKKQNVTKIPADLHTQESQHVQHEVKAMQHLSFPATLPMEILASVRKTQRILQKNHAQQPFAKQRVMSKKSHTVIMEKGYDEQNVQRAKEQRFGAGKTTHKSNAHLRRERRELRNDKVPPLQPLISESKIVANAFDARHGAKILLHLNELLKNASDYLPDDLETDAIAAGIRANANSYNFNNPAQRLYGLPTHMLTGEIAPEIFKIGNEKATERIIEKAVHTADLVLNEMLGKRAVTPSEKLPTTIRNVGAICNGYAAANASDAITKQLPANVTCTRRKITPKPATMKSHETKQHNVTTTITITTTSTSTTTKPNSKRYGERLREKSPTASVTFLKGPYMHTAHKKRLRNRLQNAAKQTHDKPAPMSKLPKHRTSRTLSGLLLYDDVMTNIRNMLQAQNLFDDEDEHTNSISRGGMTPSDTSTSTVAPLFLPSQLNDFNVNADEDAAAGDSHTISTELNALNVYLHELRSIVANLPQQQTMTAYKSHSQSQSQSQPRHDTTIKRSNNNSWYLINDNGRIFETALTTTEYQPNVTLFHSFPDMPIKNDTQSAYAIETRTIEIL